MTTNSHLQLTVRDQGIGNHLKSPVSRLRLVSYVEGVSLFLLVAVAVPLKYAAGIPQLVAVLGPMHGAAFIIYWLQLLNCAVAGRWTFGDIAKAGLASFIPLGFLTVRRLFARKDQQRVKTSEPIATS